MTPPDTATDLPARYRWTVAEYQRLGELGVFDKNHRVELIDGEIMEMAPIGSLHAGRVDFLFRQLVFGLGDKAWVSAQNPLVLGDYSAPQPDIAVPRWRDDHYETAHPTAADVLLLIEVADTTVRSDRQVKLPLYARHGIPEVWLLDPPAHCLEAYRRPLEGRYQPMEEYRGGRISPLLLPELVLELPALLR